MMIAFNAFTINLEGWYRYVAICSVDTGWGFGALFYIGRADGCTEFDLLWIRLLVDWWVFGRGGGGF